MGVCDEDVQLPVQRDKIVVNGVNGDGAGLTHFRSP